ALGRRRADPTEGGDGPRREAALDATLAVWLLASVLAHAPFAFDPHERQIPLRHFAPALVPAAILAARAIVRLRRGAEVEVARPRRCSRGPGPTPPPATPTPRAGSRARSGRRSTPRTACSPSSRASRSRRRSPRAASRSSPAST